MKKKIKYYFYHQKNVEFKGIKSFYEIYKKPTKKLKLSKNLKGGCNNIIIENFSNEDLKKIKQIKKISNTKIILILTEFFNPKVKILNNFNLKSSYLNIFLEILLIAFKLLSFLKRNIYNKFVSNKKKFKNKKLKEKRQKSFLFYLHTLVTWKRRYNNLIKIIPFCDLIVTSHPVILKHQLLKNKKKIFYPYQIKINDKSKKKLFGFGGALTAYRKLFFKKLQILNSNKPYSSDLDVLNKKINFASDDFITNHENKNYFFFNLHPKKFEYWPHTSPLRYIDSISFGEIPIIFDNFINDKFSNNLTIKINPNKKNSLNKLYRNRYKVKKIFFKKIKKIKKLQEIKYLNFEKVFLNS